MSVPPFDSLFEIAVVGTGTVGLATALGCAQQGHRVALIGPAPAAFVPSEQAPFDARIYALAPASVALLARLRVWSQVDPARIQDVARMIVHGDAGGRLTFDAWTAAVGQLAVIVEEAQLLRVLAAACVYAPIERFVTGFERMQLDADAVRLLLADGTALGARLVVGADGARSAVRAAAGIGARDLPYGQTAIVANFVAPQAHGGAARQWFTDQGVIALLPLPERALSLVWSAPEALAGELVTLSPQQLAARVMGRVDGAYGPLQSLGAAAAFPLRRIDVARLVQPRLALVGDAAHVIHPLAGQGLNLGLQDVSELIGVLAGGGAGRSDSDPGAIRNLRHYERMRAEPIGSMRFVTDGLARLFAIDDPIARRVRNIGMSLVDGAGPFKRMLVRHALG
jgi:2-polyprenylphenol 6-hydroxylase